MLKDKNKNELRSNSHLRCRSLTTHQTYVTIKAGHNFIQHIIHT